MPRPSVPASHSRVYQHTVKRQLEITLTLPQIQQHGFTHPQNGFWLMLPKEFDVILAFEPRALVQVILEVLRQTIGMLGDGPGDRKLWAALSYGYFARTGHMSRSTAQRALHQAVQAGYLLRRRTSSRTWEYSLRWKSTN
jgi:hypothetical protein